MVNGVNGEWLKSLMKYDLPVKFKIFGFSPIPFGTVAQDRQRRPSLTGIRTLSLPGGCFTRILEPL